MAGSISIKRQSVSSGFSTCRTLWVGLRGIGQASHRKRIRIAFADYARVGTIYMRDEGDACSTS